MNGTASINVNKFKPLNSPSSLSNRYLDNFSPIPSDEPNTDKHLSITNKRILSTTLVILKTKKKQIAIIIYFMFRLRFITNANNAINAV